MNIQEYNDLIKMVDSKDVISFDIFDTLLLRNVLKPSDIFKILGDEVEKRYGIVDFSLLRIKAEEKSRLPENGYETTLDKIYESLNISNLNKKAINEIKQMEINLEKKFLTVNPFMKKVYDYCMKKHKKVLCITDMYLPINVIKEVLEKNGYSKVEVFLSCDFMKQKRDGSLYSLVYSKKQYDKKRWLHIGDNYESDFVQAQNFGISAYHYKKVSERFQINSDVDYSIAQSVFLASAFNIDYNQNSYIENFPKILLMIYSYTRWIFNKCGDSEVVNFLESDLEVIRLFWNFIIKKENAKIITKVIKEEDKINGAKNVILLKEYNFPNKNNNLFSLFPVKNANNFISDDIIEKDEFINCLQSNANLVNKLIKKLEPYYDYINDESIDDVKTLFELQSNNIITLEKNEKKKKENKFLHIFDRETIIATVLMIGILVLFLCIPMFIMPDAAEYYQYLDIFNGITPLSSWNVTRGFSFPLVLFIITKIFGDSQVGLLIGTSLFYILFNVSMYIVYRKIKESTASKFRRFIITILFYLLLLFNPVIFGYFHALYTEIVAIPLAFISCMIAYKFLNYKMDFKNYKTYLYLLFYILNFIFCWFLKQPYFTIALFPLVIVVFLSIFKYKSFKDFILRSALLLISGLVLIFSISLWKSFLVSNGVDYEHGRNNENFLRRAFILGLSNFRIDENEANYNKDAVQADPLISEFDKNQIDNRDYKKYVIINVYDRDDNIFDKMIMYYDGDDYSSKESLNFWLKALKKYPGRVFNSYYNGYLATIDIYVSMRDGNGDYFPFKEFKPDYNHENQIVGLAYTYLDENFLWLYDFPWLVEASKDLHRDININENITQGVIKYSSIHFVAFKIAFLILPFIIIILVWKYIFKGNHKKRYEFALILLGFAFLHIIFHVVMGAIIDRYVFIVFPEIIMGILALLVPDKISYLERENVMIKNNRTIFVIPAYNEEKHIEGVIQDIRKNMPEADIVITNDYSKDKTKEIVESLGVTCLNVPFNMGYAMAVQTGIKYAYMNDYDYVIQFDADGQHLASEAKKLYEKMKVTHANIVIGSRFLEKTDYKHPFFRRVGTKMFQVIIKIFCNKEITDPTSGFQLLDRSVIERYAQIGKYPEFPDANLIIEMLLNGYSIEEVSVKMKLNDEGKSMHGGIIKPIKYMINVTYTILFILLRGRTRK